MPNPPAVSVVLWDKFNHFFSFFTLAFLSYLSLPMNSSPKAKLKNSGIAYLLLFAYGISIEILQWALSTQTSPTQRYFELMDIVADVLGIVAFVLVLLAKQALFKPATQNEAPK